MPTTFFNKQSKRPSKSKPNDITNRLLSNELSDSSAPYISMNEFNSRSNSASTTTARTIDNDLETSKLPFDLVIVLPNNNYKSDDKSSDNVKKNDKEKVKVEEDDDDDEGLISHDEFMDRANLAGFITYQYYSVDEKYIFIKIKAPLEVLQDHATEIEYKIRLDEEYLRNHVDSPHLPIAQDPNVTKLTPYQYIYGKYEKDKSYAYAKALGYNHPFNTVTRIKLMISILEYSGEGGLGLEIDDAFIECFPLHTPMERDQLARYWLNWYVQPWDQPIGRIKDYFGEKIGLYFAFMGHYTTWLLPLSFFGILVAFDLSIEAGVDASVDEAILHGYSVPFYGIFVSFWSQLMLEYWKRKEARLAMEWGQTGFEESEIDRPEFVGEKKYSVVTGRKIKYFPTEQKVKKHLYSYLVISGMVSLVIGCVSLIFYLQYFFQYRTSNAFLNTNGGTIVSVASAVQIQVLSFFYQNIAKSLTDNENHRTDTEYDDALIAKLYAFSFINSYASLYFIAFIKSSLEPCNGPCMVELAYQLAVIFATNLTVGKIQNYVLYRISKKLLDKNIEELNEIGRQKNVNNLGSSYEISIAEKEFLFEDYDESTGVLEDFAQLATQYGYTTLFVSACPLAPLFAYLSNILEFRWDGWKLLYITKRSIPRGAEDIGTWAYIFQLTAIMAVITNAGLLCFTMQLIKIDESYRIWLFIILQYFILLCLAFFSYVVDDVPEDVQIQLDRQDHLCELFEMQDDDREELFKEQNKHDHQIDIIAKPRDRYRNSIHPIDMSNQIIHSNLTNQKIS